jgi:hypothetical protein
MGLQLVKLLDKVQFINIPGGLVPKGAYDNSTDYDVGDMVDYQGSSYVMYADAAAGNLPTDTDYWGVVAEKGEPGIQGDPGAGGVVQSVVAGTNVTVDDSDPANPVVSASGGSGYEPKNSIEVDADELQLVGDSATPGNTKYYGTDGSGTKGFHSVPSGGAVAWGDITGTLSSQTDLDTALGAKAPINSPTFTGTVSGISKSMVGLGNVTDDAQLKIASNLSDLNNASTARTNLGVAIGSNVQAWDADLDTWATKTAPSGTVVGTTDTQTLTNKRRTRRVATTNAPGATPTTNSDNVDVQTFTGLATAITSMTTNLSGTPVDGDLLEFRFLDDGTARAITWGASFASSGTVTLPTTTVISTVLRVGFEYSTINSLNKWVCIAKS